MERENALQKNKYLPAKNMYFFVDLFDIEGAEW